MKHLTLFLLGFTLVGCTTYQVRVTTFHNLSPKPDEALTINKTFDVVPAQKTMKGSLGFEAKAGMISARLEQFGMKRNKKSPELLVYLGYAIGDGRTKSGSSPVYGQTGGGSTAFSGSTFGSGGSTRFSGNAYSTPTYGVTGYQSYSYTQYTRTMSIDIVDVEGSTKDDVKKVYEARVRSVGSSGVIDKVVPYMIEAVFRDFPGQSGKTKKYSISEGSIDKKKEKP